MRTILKWAAAIGLAACLGSSANAQGFGRGMGGGGLALLSNKSVQKELKLSDEQIEKATQASTEQMEKMRDKFGELRDLDQAERQEKTQVLMKEAAAEAKKVTDQLLKPEQAKRFAQISLQQQGFQAYSDPEIQGKLKLTDEQKNKIKDMVQESQQQMQELREQFQSDREGAMKKMTEIREGLAKKGADLLTDDQKKTWKEMAGEPFTMVREAPRRPGGAN